ncbi:hypothetical protein B0H67DRAFT_679432 [Lasiosphaeris hirsuta]|uniref:Uncharacterized protein n=1 Tax=Lasiosphaeris hirsuta TaxID=260670 RepID=A0AA40BCV5_9PEZI|nr:hypothetical protein B0H67DRAFT_679432 [Lasiosphaeris hirsuta]
MESLEPEVLTMVDQLWMWVLVGPDGRADTVISCFPQAEAPRPPDSDGVTDVLRQIKLQLLTDPFSVKTAYDLAAVIASKCSRAYLDTGSLDARLRFAEVYETTIGEVMRKETKLFQDFTLVNKTSEQQIKTTEAVRLLQEIARVQALDISEEIALLQEIKDVQDELGIMAMLFEDQKRVLAAIDNTVVPLCRAHTRVTPFVSPSPVESDQAEEPNLPWFVHVSQAAMFVDRSTPGKEPVWKSPRMELGELAEERDTSKQTDLGAAGDTSEGHQNPSSGLDVGNFPSAHVAKDLQDQLNITIRDSLPMSFMAAFFAINIAQFPHDSNGSLGLGFVSQVMFPVSVVITVALIYIAFKIENIEEGWSQTAGALGAIFGRLWG